MNKIKNNCNRSKCPITNTLDIIGDKWTLLIIRDMDFFQKKQFNELLNSHEGISTNILTARLKKLMETGLVKKQVYQENPKRYEYTLTSAGKTLRPLLVEMVKWGGEHIEGSYAPSKEDIKKILDE